MRNTDGVIECLDFQSSLDIAFHLLNYILVIDTFDWKRSRGSYRKKRQSIVLLIEIDSFENEDEFRAIFGNINTSK